MDLDSTPNRLACSECGEAITDAGYLPAAEGGTGYEPRPDAAVCDACGFNEVGMQGCAPELDDVVVSGAADVLLYVRRTDDGLEVVSRKE
jgi:hypothetical protein